MIDKISNSLIAVQNWVECQQYRGYEPFDGLSSFLKPLTFNNLLAERLLQQLIRQSPINLRPMLGVRKKESTKGRGYMAWGYLLLYRTTQDEECRRKAVLCLEWLDQQKSPLYNDHSWANFFDFSGRGGKYVAQESIIVWTSLIGQAFLEAFEQLQDQRFLDVAESACRWVLALPREKTPQGNCLSYLAARKSSIHNANMLGAALLARTWKHLRKPELIEVATSAMLYTCSRQREDGSWWYAELPRYHWIDNFHTGYNLDSLDCYSEATGDRQFEENLRRGLSYYKEKFFEADGCPKYYHDQTYPIDIQCAGQSIDTLALFSDRDPECLALSEKVASWTIDHMQDRRGYFYYRKYPFMTARTPMLHWGQATMFKALALLVGRLQPTSERPIRVGNYSQ
jgi:hypothetical protein